ncbi:MAG: hypothetical protein E7K04_02360 [Helicobacter sp.]|nr:hypothetical protein [Helicobacter sp.]
MSSLFWRVVGAIALVILIALGGGLFYYYKVIFTPSEVVKTKDSPTFRAQNKEQKLPFIFKNKDISLPVSEKSFKVEFQSDEQRAKNQIVIKNIDEEMLFCLREVFKDEEVNYAYHQSGNDLKNQSLDLIIYPENKLSHIKALLNYYEIKIDA